MTKEQFRTNMNLFPQVMNIDCVINKKCARGINIVTHAD
jgi:hypothetical protein